jgi:hypothetical protein
VAVGGSIVAAAVYTMISGAGVSAWNPWSMLFALALAPALVSGTACAPATSAAHRKRIDVRTEFAQRQPPISRTEMSLSNA